MILQADTASTIIRPADKTDNITHNPQTGYA